MNSIQRLRGFFADSPTYGRDYANLISGTTIGIASLLLNGAVLLFLFPLLQSSNSFGARSFTENIEFGQLLALVLIGGATGFATLLIPLRLVTVFREPRLGRYFDQIVLSGISPLRFLIGKVASQNLFLGLILFLLLPYFVLSLTLGGVDIVCFIASLFLLWLYCMELALVSLWLSLYWNEAIATFIVILAAALASAYGSAPIPYQPFLMTPFPALVNPVYATFSPSIGYPERQFFQIFVLCATCMTSVIVVSLFAIYLGPLYGLIRDNSTFGEVVFAGDSKRKRWLRIRWHIQRPSEIAYFYQNRSRFLLRHEGLIRWGFGLCVLLLLLSGVEWILVGSKWRQIQFQSSYSGPDFFIFSLMTHGWGLVFASILFSHAKNTTYQRMPLIFGWKVEISLLDTVAFLLFAMISTAVSIGVPFLVERLIAEPAGTSIFSYQGNRGPITIQRVLIEGTAVISVCGLVIYAWHRCFCLTSWIVSTAFFLVAIAYYFLCLALTLGAIGALSLEEIQQYRFLVDRLPTLAMFSPATVFIKLMNLQSDVESDFLMLTTVSTTPFYVFHAILLVLALFGIRRNGRKLRASYLPRQNEESN